MVAEMAPSPKPMDFAGHMLRDIRYKNVCDRDTGVSAATFKNAIISEVDYDGHTERSNAQKPG